MLDALGTEFAAPSGVFGTASGVFEDPVSVEMEGWLHFRGQPVSPAQ